MRRSNSHAARPHRVGTSPGGSAGFPQPDGDLAMPANDEAASSLATRRTRRGGPEPDA
jgi:hypothetical protein